MTALSRVMSRRSSRRLILITLLLATLMGTVHLQTIVQLQIQNSAAVVRAMNEDERHERLLRVRQNNSRQAQRTPKLTKPILNHVQEGGVNASFRGLILLSALVLNSPPNSKDVATRRSSTRITIKTTTRRPTVEQQAARATTFRSDVRMTRPKGANGGRQRAPIVSSSSNQAGLPPSRLYLLERAAARPPAEFTRTTQPPAIVRLSLPKTVDEHEENQYGIHSRIIVDVDEEQEASGFNELEELDSHIVPFQPRNHRWHLKSTEAFRSRFVLPPVGVSEKRVLHRGENEI